VLILLLVQCAQTVLKYKNQVHYSGAMQ